jgi:hypothetical protein
VVRRRALIGVLLSMAAIGVAATWRVRPTGISKGAVVVTAPPLSRPERTSDQTIVTPADPGIVREAERQLHSVLPSARISATKAPRVANIRQRVVCGEIVLNPSNRVAESKRYVSFGGTGIAVADDGSAGFAEIYESACGSPNR